MLISLRPKGLALALAVMVPSTLLARTVTIPPGTMIYGETDERVTSRVKKEGTEVGDVVRSHVWRDVVVDGEVVIKAGTPMFVRVGMVKKAKMAGIKGKLELEAVSTKAVDGTDIMLDGGYDKSGRGRKALSITLAAAVAWPLIFIHGKAAELNPGTVFDCEVQAEARVSVEGAAPPRKIKLGQADFSAEVLYDKMDPEGKDKTLPLRLTSCAADPTRAMVVTVNGADIHPSIPVRTGSTTKDGDCTSAEGSLDLKELGKHFGKGINRFEVGLGDERAEIVLDVEL